MARAEKGPVQKKAVLYARVSSKEQEAEGYSIPAQLKLLRAEAERLGFEVVNEFQEAQSAKESGRLAFGEMKRFLISESRLPLERRCRVVFVEKVDRLYRNFKDYVELDPDDLDIELRFVKDNQILNRESRSHEKFIHAIKVTMAKGFCDNLSEETKKGMEEKLAEGVWPGPAPLGYRNITVGRRKDIEVDPDTAPLVRKLFELYATGNYSLRQVVAEAVKMGMVYQKTGNPIKKPTIHKILNNPMYYGQLRYKGKLYPGAQEPIITKDLFDRVQEVQEDHRVGGARVRRHHWLFQGLMRCGHCGCTLVAEPHKGGRYVYYICTHNRGNCPEKRVPEKEVARQYREAIQSLRLTPEQMESLVLALRESHAEERKFHTDALAAIEKDLHRVELKQHTLYEDRLEGIIPKELYQKESATYEDERRALQERLVAHQKANVNYLDGGIRLLEIAQGAVVAYDQQSDEEKRKLLGFVCLNSTWKDGRLHVTFRKPFNLLGMFRPNPPKGKSPRPESGAVLTNWLPGRDLNPRPSD